MQTFFISLFCITLLVFAQNLEAQDSTKHSHKPVSTQASGSQSFLTPYENQKNLKHCIYCGMDRDKFAHSRMLIEYEDGSVSGLCSLHCSAIDLSVNIGKSVKAISVGDYNTKKLTDAERAFWVVGGSIQGVMTKRAKWAFENEADARAFVNAHGGKIVTFEDALKSAYEDMYEDTKMIREKRKKMRMSKPAEQK